MNSVVASWFETTICIQLNGENNFGKPWSQGRSAHAPCSTQFIKDIPFQWLNHNVCYLTLGAAVNKHNYFLCYKDSQEMKH